MPDTLAVAVTSGLGVSLIAGIVSGICYIVVQGFSKKRKIKNHSLWHCNVCGAQFRSIEGVLDVGKVVACAKCGSKVCRFRCARKSTRVGWICRLRQQPEHWLKGLFQSIMSRSSRENLFIMDPKRIDEIDEDLEILRKKEKEHVRDFIERIVEAMLGSNVDNVSVAKLYNDKTYLPITGETPCSAHASLKQLIQRIIQEALNLPQLSKAYNYPAQTECASDRTYEDLLATAILNKVIQSYQDELPTSSGNSASSQLSTPSRQSHNKEYFFGEETLNSKWKSNPLTDDTKSTASIEEWVHRKSSPATKHFDQIETHQEIEVSSSDDEDTKNPQLIHTDSLLRTNGYSEEWHENWLMQKRKLTGTASPVPVPMLVPNPNTEAKVKIGDKEAEDTSDLSDIGSDFGEMESSQDIKTILVDSKTVIGGKNLFDKINLQLTVESISDDESTSVSDLKEETDDIIKRFTNTDNSINENKISTADIAVPHEVNNFTSLESNTEKDSEYTESYASLPRTVLKPSDIQSTNSIQDKSPLEQTLETQEQTEQNNTKEDENKLNENELQNSSNDDDRVDHFKGSYAEREKKKWYQSVVELKNNPYSEENLQRRLSTQSSSSSSSLFGRDYYIKQSARSAGASKSKKEKLSYEHQLSSHESPSQENKNDYQNGFSSPTHFPDIQDSPLIYSQNIQDVQLSESFISEKPVAKENDRVQSQSNCSETIHESSECQPQNLKINSKSIIEAKNTEALLNFEEKSETAIEKPSLRPTSLEISSDSDKSLERIYNVETGKVMVRIGERIKEIEEDLKSPECLKYISKDTEFKTDAASKTFIDENHNVPLDMKTFQQEPSTNERNEYKNSLSKTNSDTSIQENVPYVGKQNIRKKIYTHFLNHSLTNTVKPLIETESERNEYNPTEVSYSIKEVNELGKPPPPPKQTNGDSNDFSLEYSSDYNSIHESKTESSPEIFHESWNSSKIVSSPETDTEISEIRSKKLVKSLLGEFSKTLTTSSQKEHADEQVKKSVTMETKMEEKSDENTTEEKFQHIQNIVEEQSMDYKEIGEQHLKQENGILKHNNEDIIKVCMNKNKNTEENGDSPTNTEINEENKEKSLLTIPSTEIEIPSVQHLKKMFDTSSIKPNSTKTENTKPVYSLTARSIPVEVRQELKNSAEKELSNVKSELIKEEPSLSEISDTVVEAKEVFFPKAKSRIQFFESLKK